MSARPRRLPLGELERRSRLAMKFVDCPHVRVGIPYGRTSIARDFYCGVLGLEEIEPSPIVTMGDIWFHCGSLRLHVVPDVLFSTTATAHATFLVDSLERLVNRMLGAGHRSRVTGPLHRPHFCQTVDPFGNHLEFIQAPPR